MYFVNAEVAEVATRTLAEIVGGVMEVSKASTTSAASATPVQKATGSFYIGDSDEQEASGTTLKFLPPKRQPQLTKLRTHLRAIKI